MGLLNNLFNVNKNDATPVNNDPIFTFVTNYLTSGADDLPDPNSKECLEISDIVFSAITRLSNDVADIPITTGTQYQSVLLNKSVGNGISTRSWVQSSMENMLLFGDSFSLIQRDNNGENVYSEYRLSLNRYTSIIVSELDNKLNGNYSMNNPIQPLNVTDLSNGCKNGAMDKQQAQDFMGLDQTPDKPNNK